MWLFTKASSKELLGWIHRPRNETGFPCGEDASWERKVVLDWAQSLQGMPHDCKDRLQNEHSAEDEDIEAGLL